MYTYKCKKCGGTVYTQDYYGPGEILPCPICGDRIVEPIRDWKGWLQRILFFMLYLGIFSTLTLFCIWAIASVTNTVKVIENGFSRVILSVQSTIPIIVSEATEIINYLIVFAIVGISILIIYFILITLERHSTKSFNEINIEVHRHEPFVGLRKLLEIPEDQPDKIVLKETVRRSGDTVIKQRKIIGLLIILLSIFVLICYLSRSTAAEPTQVVKKTIQLGTVNVVIFAFAFYSTRSFIKLDKKLKFVERKYRKAISLSIIFGLATVLTMVLFPLFLKEAVSGSEIAIGLTINVIVDVLVMTYDKIVEFLWKKPKDIYSELISYLIKKIQQIKLLLIKYWEKIRDYFR